MDHCRMRSSTELSTRGSSKLTIHLWEQQRWTSGAVQLRPWQWPTLECTMFLRTLALKVSRSTCTVAFLCQSSDLVLCSLQRLFVLSCSWGTIDQYTFLLRKKLRSAHRLWYFCHHTSSRETCCAYQSRWSTSLPSLVFLTTRQSPRLHILAQCSLRLDRIRSSLLIRRWTRTLASRNYIWCRRAIHCEVRMFLVRMGCIPKHLWTRSCLLDIWDLIIGDFW